MTWRSVFISLLILLAIGISGLSIFHRTQNIETTNNTTNTEQADTAIENVVATIFDKQGNPALKVVTPKMVHFPKNDITEITMPKIILAKEPKNIWYIDSNHAQVLNSINEIIFHDHVVVRHQDTPQHPMTTMYTQSLTIFPDKQLAETHDAISITQPEAKVDAVGMQANMHDGTIKLLSQAKEEYVPNPS